VRKKAVVVLLLVVLCYIFGLITASYLNRHEGRLGLVLTRLLHGKVEPLIVRRDFNQTIYYVTDRKEVPVATATLLTSATTRDKSPTDSSS